MRRLLTLLTAMMLGVGMMPGVASAEDAGSVSGTVRLDGVPLAGVAVTLWGDEVRTTCTDANGEFEFSELPLNTEFFAATGPDWDFGCENAKFFDPASNPNRPLMPQFYDHSNSSALVVPPTAFFAPNAEINFDVIRLPVDRLAINNDARLAMIYCFDEADANTARAFIDRLLDKVDKDEGKGKIGSVAANRYRTYAAIVTWSWGVTCPASD